jgi:hypothetical protein
VVRGAGCAADCACRRWVRQALEKRPFFEMVEREQARLRQVVLMQRGLLEDGDDGGGHTMLPPSTVDRVVPLDGKTLPPKEHVPPKAHYPFHVVGDSRGTIYQLGLPRKRHA